MTQPDPFPTLPSDVPPERGFVHPSGVAYGWWTEDEILHMKIGTPAHEKGALFTEADALIAGEVVEHLIEGIDRFVTLVDIRGLRRSSAKARRMMPNPKTERMAILVKSPVNRMLGNAYLGITRPLCLTRLYTRIDKANAWLLEGQ